MSIARGMFSVLSFVSLMIPGFIFGQGYRIEITMEGLSRDTLVLGEYFTTRMIPKDTLVLDQKGYGVFEDDQTFQGGLYIIYFDPNHYFDLILGGDQDLAINADLAIKAQPRALTTFSKTAGLQR